MDTKETDQPIEFNQDLIKISNTPTVRWLPSFNILNSKISEAKRNMGYNIKLNDKLCQKCSKNTQLYVYIEYVKDKILTRSPYYSICCFEHLFALYDLFSLPISLHINTSSINKYFENIFKYNYHYIYLESFSIDNNEGDQIEHAYKLLSNCMIHCDKLMLTDMYFHDLWNEIIPCLLTLLHKNLIGDYVKLSVCAEELKKYIEIFNAIGINCQIPSCDDEASCDIHLYKDEIIISILTDDDHEKTKFSYSYNGLLV